MEVFVEPNEFWRVLKDRKEEVSFLILIPTKKELVLQTRLNQLGVNLSTSLPLKVNGEEKVISRLKGNLVIGNRSGALGEINILKKLLFKLGLSDWIDYLNSLEEFIFSLPNTEIRDVDTKTLDKLQEVIREKIKEQVYKEVETQLSKIGLRPYMIWGRDIAFG